MTVDRKYWVLRFWEAAAEWLKIRMKDKAVGYLKSIHLRLNKYILPYIGNLKLRDIKAPVILKLCRQIEIKGFYDTAHSVRGLIGQIFRFSIASNWCENAPTITLISRQTLHYAHKPRWNGFLMRSIKAILSTLWGLQCCFQSTRRRVRVKSATLNTCRNE